MTLRLAHGSLKTELEQHFAGLKKDMLTTPALDGGSPSFWNNNGLAMGNGVASSSQQLMSDVSGDDSDDDLLEVCGCGPSTSAKRVAQSDNSGACTIKQFCCSKPGRLLLFISSMLAIYLVYHVVFALQLSSTGTYGLPDDNNFNGRAGDKSAFNQSRAITVLESLCNSYTSGEASGDLCNRLCFDLSKWTVLDLYEGNKIVIILRGGGQEIVLKSQHPMLSDFQELEPSISEEDFTDKVVEMVNYATHLGWPQAYKLHLLETIWPIYSRSSHAPLSKADRRSLWALIQQDEYITFRVLPLTRVTPKIVGSCGHFYQVEHLVAFRMKGYYTNLKAKILVHLMGTLKLFYEFLNEPLQWCDVKFDNLGLSADYPKRFLIMDGDMLYTESKLRSMLTTKRCRTDEDCRFFDCDSRCDNLTRHCTDRTNDNVDVFCKKLVNHLFGNFWSKSNRYLAACHDKSMNATQRLADLRLSWSWNLADV